MPPASTVLLIDDDDLTRELLSLLLEGRKWSVAAASSGEAALHLLATSNPPALILSDLHMPGLCGPDLATALRRLAPAAVLLAMTATPSSAAPPAGYDALLIKPFGADTIEQHYNAVQLPQSNPSCTSVLLETSSAFDPAVLENLRRSMPDDRLHALLAMTLEDAELRIARMCHAAATGDDVLFRSEAHALKGSSSFVGAIQLRTLAAHAEAEGLPVHQVPRWSPSVDFNKATSEIRLILNSLSRGAT